MANLQATFPLRKKTSSDGTIKIYRLAYNQLFPKDYNDLQVEMAMQIKYEYGALPGGEEAARPHIKNAMCLLDPEYGKGWNPWSDLFLDLFTKDDPERLWRVLWGSANCGKSRFAGLFLYEWWLSDPYNKGVLLFCKSLTDSMDRIFSYMEEIHESVAPMLNFSTEVKRTAQNKYKAAGIFPTGRAAEGVSSSKRGGIRLRPVKVDKGSYGDNLIGWHPQKGLRAAGDEIQELEDRLMFESKCTGNWTMNENVKAIGWGNPSAEGLADYSDLLTYLGEYDAKKMPDPKKTNSWENQLAYVSHVSLMDCPIDYPEHAHLRYIDEHGVDRHQWWFLQGKKKAKVIANQAKGDWDCPNMWSQVYGFPKPGAKDNKDDCVISSSDIKRYGGFTSAKFDKSKPILWFAGSDTSLTNGGSDCVILFAKYGFLMDGRPAVDLMGGKHVYVMEYKDENQAPREYREKIEFLQKKYQVPATHFFIEAWGTAQTIGHELKNYWSEDWFHIGPSEKLSGRQTTPDSPRAASKEFVSSITEYNFAVKGLTMTGQIFGFSPLQAKQFGNRKIEYNEKKGKKGLEDKMCRNKNIGKNRELMDDHSDSVAILIEGLRRTQNFQMRQRSRTNRDLKNTQAYQPPSQPEISRAEFTEDINDFFGSL